jgi:hypothetical protein
VSLVVIEDITNNPPREQWLARLDVGATSLLSSLIVGQPSCPLSLNIHQQSTPREVAREAGCWCHVIVVYVRWPAQLSVVTEYPPHEQRLVRLEWWGHCYIHIS